MNAWKIILATVVIFGAGVMTGGLLVNDIEHSHRNGNHRPLAAESHGPNTGRDQPSRFGDQIPHPRAPDLLNTNFVTHLNDQLKLTPEQSDTIRQIIAEGQERNHAIWTNNVAQMRVVMQDVRHRVRDVLTADQQKQFEELMRRVPRRPPNATNAPPVEAATNPPAAAPAP